MNYDPSPIDTGEHQLNRMEAEVYPDLVESYTAFKDHMHPKADVIYHPCSANDVSPSEVFPDSRVVYVDLDKNAMEALERTGHDAHIADVRKFDPGDVDVLFLLNPSVSPEVPSSHVVEGGFVVCNDYHGTASELHASGEYVVKAIIERRANEIIFDDADPEDYWKEVETEEEFQRASGSMNATNYSQATRILEAMTVQKEDILDGYKALLKRAQEEDLEKRRELWAQPPDQEGFAFFGGVPEEAPDQPEPQIDSEGPWQLTSPTGELVLISPLPRKNGREEDIFVFQKKVKAQLL